MVKSIKTVLVIEDSLVQAASIGQLLAQEGLRVLHAYNGRAGVHMAQEFVPDAIVLDLQMPEMNGFEVCNHLKDDARTSGIPVVVLTAHADSVEMILRGIDMGALDYIPKDSFADAVLLETLRQLHVLENVPGTSPRQI
jgi:two-component system alkaline phosphatase synthesis response regulator PhoP